LRLKMGHLVGNLRSPSRKSKFREGVPARLVGAGRTRLSTAFQYFGLPTFPVRNYFLRDYWG